jgi:hypothetical protein
MPAANTIKPLAPCLITMNQGRLCMAPAIQIHPELGPMCALHLYHERRSQKARPNLQVRVDAQDLEALDQLAQAHNLTRSEAFRRVLKKLPFPRAKVDADTYRELRRVGVNVNQIAKCLNSGDAPELEVIQQRLDDLSYRLEEVALLVCGDQEEQEGEP